MPLKQLKYSYILSILAAHQYFERYAIDNIETYTEENEGTFKEEVLNQVDTTKKTKFIVKKAGNFTQLQHERYIYYQYNSSNKKWVK
jgi:Golgi nucleoside diphosphatase